MTENTSVMLPKLAECPLFHLVTNGDHSLSILSTRSEFVETILIKNWKDSSSKLALYFRNYAL